MSDKLSRTSKNRRLNKRAKVILFIISLAVFITVPVIYTKVVIPKLDQERYEQVIDSVDNFLENKYTGAIKESVTKSDVEQVKSKIYQIHDKKLRDSANNTTSAVLNQVTVQTATTANLKKILSVHKYADIKRDRLVKIIANAGEIKNVKLKAKVLKQANGLLEQIDYTASIIKEVGKLKVGDWTSYYTAEADVDTITYSEVKTDLKKKLEKIKNSNQSLDTTKSKNDAKQLERDIKSASTFEDSSVKKGKSSRLTVSNKAEGVALAYFLKHSSTQYALVTDAQTIYLYERGDKSAKLITSDKFTGSVSQTETTNVTVENSGISASLGNDGSSVSNTEQVIIRVGSMIIGNTDSNDLKTSSAFLNKVAAKIKDKECAFINAN